MDHPKDVGAALVDIQDRAFFIINHADDLLLDDEVEQLLYRVCDECEKLGIKTVLIDNEWLGPDGAGGLPLLDMSPNANAMISVGNMDEVVDLPPMERVVGGHTMPDIQADLRDEASIPLRCIANGTSQIGFTFLTTEIR